MNSHAAVAAQATSPLNCKELGAVVAFRRECDGYAAATLLTPNQRFMSNNEPDAPRGQDPKGGGDPGFNWRGLILLLIAVSLIGTAFFFKGGDRTAQVLNWQEFLAVVESGALLTDEKHLLEIVRQEGTAEEFVAGTFVADDANRPGEKVERDFKATVNVGFAKEELLALLKAHPEIRHTFRVDRNWGGAVPRELASNPAHSLDSLFLFSSAGAHGGTRGDEFREEQGQDDGTR